MIVSKAPEEQGDENNPSRQPFFCLQPVCAGFISSIKVIFTPNNHTWQTRSAVHGSAGLVSAPPTCL